MSIADSANDGISATTETPTGGLLISKHQATRKDIVAAVSAHALEFYDFTVFAFFAVMIGKTFFPSDNAFVSLLLAVATYGVGFVMRPIGSIVFGRISDSRGRKPAFLLTMAFMTVGTLTLAATPSFATIGIAAPIIVIIGRLIQGLALGGETGTATSYLVELAPPGRAGLFSSWLWSAQGLATVAAGVVGVALSWLLPEESMSAWGWRVPFFLSLLIIPIGIHFRKSLPETLPTEERTRGAGQTSVLGLLRQNLKTVVLATIVLSSLQITFSISYYMTTYAIAILHLPTTMAMTAAMIVGVSIVVGALIAGFMCDRYGRKLTLIAPRILLVLVAYPVFANLLSSPGLPSLAIVTAVVTFLSIMSAVAIFTLLPEALPPAIRATAVSLTFALASSLFGSTTQFAVTALIGWTGDAMAPAYYVIASSLVGLVAMALLPETRSGPRHTQ